MHHALRLGLATLATAVLLVATMPPGTWAAAAWVAYVPVLVVSRRPVEALGCTILATAAMVLAVETAGLHGRPVEDGMPQCSYVAAALFAAITGAVAAIHAGLRDRGPAHAATVACAAVVAEAGTFLVLPAHFALTQHREPAMLALASVTGIWGVSWLLWAANSLVARFAARGDLRRAGAVLAGVAAVVAAGRLLAPAPETGPLAVAMVQSGTNSGIGMGRRNADAGRQGAALAVWPELSGMSMARGGDASQLVALAREPGQPSFVTTFQSGDKPLPRNVCAVFGPDGESERYAKRRLFAGEVWIHTPGDRAVAVPVRAGGAPIVAGLLVCFDGCFPSLVRETASLPGVSILFQPTLDPDTPSGFVQAVHAAFTPFRAAENGVPIVRTDRTAASHAVDANGTVTAECGAGTDEVRIAHVAPGRRATIYSAIGDVVPWICAASLVAAIVVAWARRRREPAGAARG